MCGVFFSGVGECGVGKRGRRRDLVVSILGTVT